MWNITFKINKMSLWDMCGQSGTWDRHSVGSLHKRARDDVLLQRGIGSWFIGSENRQRTLIISFLYNLTASVARRFLRVPADLRTIPASPTVLTHNTKLLLPSFTISHYLQGSDATRLGISFVIFFTFILERFQNYCNISFRFRGNLKMELQVSRSV